MKKINIDDTIYPERLRNIPNPPKSLYLEGNLSLLNNDIISIIGSRCCSENGVNITKKFASLLSACGITIASGLAIGIDSVAHLHSYENIGRTIAVLGNGFYHIFPEENIPLYNKILENDGLIISEYPPNTKCKSKYFLERNRIVSGISLGILVIEAAHRSGTSVTAKLAYSQNRKVFAIPHEIWDFHGVGTNKLIKEGANLVTCPEDILNNLNLNKYLKKLDNKDTIKKIKTIEKNFNIQNPDKIRTIKNNFEIQNSLESKPNNFKKTVTLKSIDNLNEDCKDIYKIISEIPISINDISKKTLKSINTISNSLLILELQGLIQKVAGGYICT